MPKPWQIELSDGTAIPILYEDRAVLAIDKPPGWMLAPDSWDRTGLNLHLALMSSIKAGDFWARSHGVKFLRFLHRLDADTSGVLLLAKSPGAIRAFSGLFESRQVVKAYVAVVHGVPARPGWICRQKLSSRPDATGHIKVDPRHGLEAETRFRVRQGSVDRAILDVQPITGRTHQIRVHLQAAGHPVLGDRLYGMLDDPRGAPAAGLGLRATALAYPCPFQRKPIRIEAPADEFLAGFLPTASAR